MIVGNPVLSGVYFVDGKWTPLMSGVRCRRAERCFGLIAVREGICTGDGRMLSNGEIVTPQDW